MGESRDVKWGVKLAKEDETTSGDPALGEGMAASRADRTASSTSARCGSRPAQERQGDAEVEQVPHEAIEERALVRAGEVEDHAGQPAAERHAEHGGHQHGADAN